MIIVPPAEISPASDIRDVSLDNPMATFKICQEMQGICEQYNGIGLSAVQVGLPQRLFLVHHENSFEFYANCDYKPLSEYTINVVEGCLSLRNEQGKFKNFDVVRYRDIRVTGWKLDVNTPEFKLVDLELKSEENQILPIVFQHEIDHGKGILISHIGREMVVW